MAENGVKISGLTAANSAADADVVAGVQSGTTKKFPLSVLFNYIKGKLTASDIGAQASITASGILKGNGSGGVSAAVAGTDYQAPLTAGTDYATPGAVTVKADKTDLTSISQTSPTATVNIASGNFFYLDGVLVQAKTAISSGDTFTSGTNYETPSAGSLNALKSAIDTAEDISSEFIVVDNSIKVKAYRFGKLVYIVANTQAYIVSAQTAVKIATYPSKYQPLSIGTTEPRATYADKGIIVKSDGVYAVNLTGQAADYVQECVVYMIN